MPVYRAKAQAGANIAFIKYWGNLDDALRLPLTNSLSMTLDRATTVTEVAFRPDLAADVLIINGVQQGGAALERVSRHLDHLRARAGLTWRARVLSENSFPTGAGIASSAAAFAALTAAAAAALGLDLSPRELSTYARLGSGSAARSVFGGFVEWVAGARHEDSYAYPIAPPSHWTLVDAVAVVSTAHKAMGSTGGHALASTSPFQPARLAHVHTALAKARSAILARDFHALGEVMELDALAMHAVMMTSRPSLLYWQPGTLAVMHAVRSWREAGIPVYFTIDAGPNVHVITLPEHESWVVAQLQAIPDVREVLVNYPGPGVRLLEREEESSPSPNTTL
ncbi:MAG: diphosphomevalonate decarboxylase [Chloroflexi bacterium]|nr:diphosphomevalonate decarboxylase [Chloroflexota bacterium]